MDTGKWHNGIVAAKDMGSGGQPAEPTPKSYSAAGTRSCPIFSEN
jgi:hypothetical protein